VGELQMDWLRSEDLKEEKVETTPWHYNTPTRNIMGTRGKRKTKKQF
jgi:hypothetical protein